MIVTSQTLKEFINIDHLDIDELCNTLSSIGLEVEKQYKIEVPKNVVVGKVIKRIQHDNADKLSVCDVDIGSEVLQIVCGAKNVRANMFVAVAKIGSILPIKDKKTDEKYFEIIESDIRGIKSSGMICSSNELGFPPINDGIMQLDESIGELELGKELRDYDIFNQTIIEIGLTPNRGDCLSVLGIAREIASSFNLIVKQQAIPESVITLGVGRFLNIIPDGDLDSSLLYKIVEIKNDYTALKIALSLAINESYQDSTISNLLEYTTYMSGVLFNAYAMDDKKISSNNNEVRLIVKKDENKLDSIYSEINNDGQSTLHKISIIGAQKYKNEIIQYPRKFILEASFTDATTLSNKIFEVNQKDFDKSVLYRSQRGSNPSLINGMAIICNSLEFLSANLYSGEQEVSLMDKDINITITFSYICSVIGNDIPKEDIAIILKKLGFMIQATSDENFIIVTPPIFRNDVKNKQDIAEEVLRLYSIDKVQSNKNIFHINNNSTTAIKKHNIQKTIRQNALANGFIECVHYLFSNSAVLKDMGFKDIIPEKALLNPITNELNTLRPSLLPSMLASASKNKAYGYENIRLFEIGYVYDENREASLELCVLIHKKIIDDIYPNPKGQEVDFFNFSHILGNIIGLFECRNIKNTGENKLIHNYQNAYIIKDSQNIGIISKLHPSIQKYFDLDSVIFAQINIDLLISIINKDINIKPFSRFQSNKRDLTVLINKDISFSQIKSSLERENIEFIKDIFALDLFNENELQNALSLRLIIQSDEKTLNDDEIKSCMTKILELLKQDFQAELKL